MQEMQTNQHAARVCQFPLVVYLNVFSGSQSHHHEACLLGSWRGDPALIVKHEKTCLASLDLASGAALNRSTAHEDVVNDKSSL